MRKRVAVLAFLVFCVSLSFASGEDEYYSYSYARLSYVKGDVFIQRADDLGYEEGTVNLVLIQGDKIGTREGRAEIHLGKRNYLRIDSQTQLDLVELPQRGYDKIQMHMLSGDIFLRINFIEGEKDFEIHTPDASFYVLEEGLYRVAVRENQQTEVLVYEGMLEAAGEEGSVSIQKDETLVAVNGYFLTEGYDAYGIYDDNFASWNRSRDEEQTRYIARRYLPDELYEYEVELAYNGRWVYEAPYGYVWVPHVRYAYWQPYYEGRWVWYPIIGWTWVSYDPWGWCVHRYGRWHWRASLGWYWIPTRVWGPAWVQWYHGYDYIGWAPLSYWNRPVVIVNNNFYGRYNDPYYPVQSRALTVVHKSQLQARSISKMALSQERVGRIGKISLSSGQPNLRPVVDRASAEFAAASKVFSRTNLRQVRQNYTSAKSISSVSRARTTSIRPSASDIRGTSAIRQSVSRSSQTGVVSRSGTASRAAGPTASSGATLSRSIRRYSSSPQKLTSSSSSSTQRSAAIPSRVKPSSSSVKNNPEPDRLSVSRVRQSSSAQAAKPENRPKTEAQKVIKKYTSSQSQTSNRAASVAKFPSRRVESSQSKQQTRSIIQKFPSFSSSPASSRGRSYAAPPRSSTRSSSSVVSRAAPQSRVSSPSRSTVSSRPSISRPSSSSSVRSSSRAPSRSSVSTRSSSSRSITSSRSSSGTKSSALSRSSSSSRSSVSRSSSSKRVKK